MFTAKWFIAGQCGAQNAERRRLSNLRAQKAALDSQAVEFSAQIQDVGAIGKSVFYSGSRLDGTSGRRSRNEVDCRPAPRLERGPQLVGIAASNYFRLKH